MSGRALMVAAPVAALAVLARCDFNRGLQDYCARFPDTCGAANDAGGDAGASDAGIHDAGQDAGADAGSRDGGATDAGPRDGGGPDAGPLDAGPAYFDVVMADGPILYYRLDETSCTVGAPVVDSSGHHRNGTYVHGPSAFFTCNYPGATRDGDGALHTDDLAIIYDGGGLPYGAAARTVECWYHSNNTPTNSFGGSLVAWGAESNRQLFDLLIDNGGRMIAATWNDDHFFTTPTSPLDDQWHHLAVTYDGTGVAAYFDGVQIGTVVATMNTSDAGFYVGDCTNGGSSYPYNGTIDEVAVYDKALTPVQVAAHFAAR